MGWGGYKAGEVYTRMSSHRFSPDAFCNHSIDSNALPSLTSKIRVGSEIQMHCRVWKAKSAWDPWHYIEFVFKGMGAASNPYPESIIRETGAASDPDTESTILYPSTGSNQMLFGNIPQIQMHCRL